MQAFRTLGCNLDMIATILLGSAQGFVRRLDEMLLVRMTRTPGDVDRGRDRQLSPDHGIGFTRCQFGTDHLHHVVTQGHRDDGRKILHAGSAVLTV